MQDNQKNEKQQKFLLDTVHLIDAWMLDLTHKELKVMLSFILEEYDAIPQIDAMQQWVEGVTGLGPIEFEKLALRLIKKGHLKEAKEGKGIVVSIRRDNPPTAQEASQYL